MSTHIKSLKLSNRLIAAPLAGLSDYAFRKIALNAGVGLVFSEMISAAGLSRHEKKTTYMTLIRDDTPIAIQIFGSNPTELACSAALLQNNGAAMIDINCGCPVPKVIKQGSGAALLKNIELLKNIIQAVRQAITIPLSIKIRSGWDKPNFIEVATMAWNEGVDLITLHPRTQKQGFSGRADWTHLKQLKSVSPIPICGSGDITEAADIDNMITTTQVDFVMIGRGLIGNPWIINEYLNSPHLVTSKIRLEALRHHCRLLAELYGEKKALFHIRKYITKYTKGLLNAGHYRQLATTISTIADFEKAYHE